MLNVLPPPELPPTLFEFLPSPPPLFSSTPKFNLPTNNNQPTIGHATEFGEIEAVKSEQELPKNDVKSEIDELMESAPSPPRLELSDEVLKVLSDGKDIINDDFVKVEELDDKDVQ